ncbi:DUF2969 family protein [Lactobacillus sp. CC-MHH1034]|uniref:DUF2969 family protein n=1 Tax=Agrilactobacillus fermenti TaxID=2586909 RepID=UPI001E4513F4|nr:DUF2969 family protein [Agrilactobacillus fermenti]MCD2256446.1 DUF2969 family protein [Agrilactobacillus fermenti]
MAKKEQKIDVEVKDISAGETQKFELWIKDSAFATITQISEQRFETQFASQIEPRHFKTLDDAINDALMEYNLHRGS